jgi:hypothetical protein
MECRSCTAGSTHSEPLCQLHGKHLDIYCEKDHKLLCSECIITQHQHHKLCTVAAVTTALPSAPTRKGLHLPSTKPK